MQQLSTVLKKIKSEHNGSINGHDIDYSDELDRLESLITEFNQVSQQLDDMWTTIDRVKDRINTANKDLVGVIDKYQRYLNDLRWK
tara:strand:+ start:308 stop:565 length:258 start_codon:yes stop_codon:yes gene_type:complete